MMIESLRARWGIIIAVLVTGLIWFGPNMIDTEKVWWPAKNKIVLGLDIQGGSHLVLRVDVDSAIRQDATRMANSLPKELADEKIQVKGATVVDPLRGLMKVGLNKPADASAVTGFLDRFYSGSFRVVETKPEYVAIEYGELYLRDFRTKLVDQAIATIRNRIDEFGVAEPSITAQGADRILVQLPGIKDSATAKDLINRTARLDFMIVSTDVQPDALQKMIADAEQAHNLKLGELKYSAYVEKLNEVLKDKLPKNTVIYFEKPEGAASLEAGRVPMLLKTDDIVTGDRLTNAQVGMGQYGNPVVNFAFDGPGSKQFGDLTRKYSQRYMAIVLDKVVKSAPVINEPITGGSGQITLGRGRDAQATLNEAKIISTALRAGALPATLEQLEERTVGPSLGADAIRKGEQGAIVACILVFVFMAIWYRTLGVVADVTLALNLFLTMAVLSTLGATLTLPGVAGLALTIGMAVDANVIIFERIKEEMRKGASLAAAIREGFDRAFSSIFDANVTSILVCVVLYYYGTGPVRGFAVTLITGLTISMFTAIFVTRAVLDLLVHRMKWNFSVIRQ